MNMWTCEDLKTRARLSLTGKYWWAVLWTFVFSLLAGTASSIVSVAATFVLQIVGMFSTLFMSGSTTQVTTESVVSPGMNASFFIQFAVWMLIFMIIVILMYAAIFLVMIFITFPLSIGYQKWYFDIREGGDGKKIDPLFSAFRKNTYGRMVRGMAWKTLWMFLWALAAAIPVIISVTAVIVCTFSLDAGHFNNSEIGMIIILTVCYLVGFGFYAIILLNKYYAYFYTSYLLLDDPTIGYREALKKSIAMSKGQKLHMFALDLSFIGWWLLVILTCGYGSIFLAPYLSATHTELFFARKAEFADITNA